MHGEDEDLSADLLFHHLLRGADAVHLAHGQIHHYHVWIHALGEGDRFAPIRGFAYHLNVLRRAQYRLHSRTHHRVVVCENHPDRVIHHEAAFVAFISAITRVPPLGTLSIFITPPASITRS